MQRPAAWGWLVAYVVASALNIASEFGADWLGTVTKPLLMPLLLGYFIAGLSGLRHRLAFWVKWALVMSWVGDLLLMPSGDVWFLLGLLGFLAAQICYISGFRGYLRAGPLADKPWLVIPYLAYWVLLVLLLAEGLGLLVVPVALYGVALVTMAITATGVSPRTAVGAVLFVASDSLIALTSLTDALPEATGLLIMPTYCLGQLLIVMGVLQRLGRLQRRETEAVPA